MDKISSLIDFPKPTLDPNVWNLDRNILNPIHKDFIIRILNKFIESRNLKADNEWITDVTLVGSICTYLWNSQSDIDVHVKVDIDKFKETNVPEMTNKEAEEYLDLLRKELDAAKLLLPLSNGHLVEYYFETKFHPANVSRVGVYSISADKWLKEPPTVPQDFDIEKLKPKIVEEAIEVALGLDENFSKVRQNLIRIEDLVETLKTWPTEKQKLYKDKINEKLSKIEEEIKEALKVKEDLVTTRHEKQDPLSDNELIFKWLQHMSYLNIISELKAIVGEEVEVIIEDLPLIEKVISEASLEVKSYNRSVASWIDLNGKVFLLDDSNFATHADWVLKNETMLKQEYGYEALDSEELEQAHSDMDYIDSYLIEKGWSRVGDVYKADFGIEVYDISDIPQNLIIYLISVPWDDKINLHLEDSSGAYVQVNLGELRTEGQKAVNKALSHKRLQTASLNKKAETVEISTTYSKGEFPVLIDPTPNEIKGLIQKSPYTELRYLYGESGSIYVWDAYRSTHAEVANQLHFLGFDVDENSSRGIISQDSQIEEVFALLKQAFLKEAGNVWDINGVNVYKNPTLQQALAIWKHSTELELRAVLDPLTNDLYMWDSYKLHHMGVIDALGIEWSDELYNEYTWNIQNESDIEGIFEFQQKNKKRLQPVSSLKEAFLKEAGLIEAHEDPMNQIFVDVDDTLFHETPDLKIGDPIEGAREGLLKLKELGYTIVLDSHRANTEKGRQEIEEAMKKYDMPYDKIYENSKPLAKVFIDDRAIKLTTWDEVIKQVENSKKTASLVIRAGDVIRLTTPKGHEIRIYRNPTPDQAENLYNQMHRLDAMRYYASPEGDLYIWDAFYLTHEMVMNYLGIEPTSETYTGAGVIQSGYQARELAKRFEKSKNLIQSSLGTKYWIDPNGKEYPIPEKLGHYGWILTNILKQPGKVTWANNPEAEQKATEMIQEGWTRITTEPDRGADFGVEVANLKKLPSYLDDFIAKHYSDNGLELDDLNGDYAIVANPFPNIQKRVNQYLNRPVMAGAFSKKEAYEKVEAFLLGPKGEILNVDRPDDHESAARKLTGNPLTTLLNEGWATLRTVEDLAYFSVAALGNIPAMVDNYLAGHKFNRVVVGPYGGDIGNLPEPPQVSYEDAIEYGIQKAINRKIIEMQKVSKEAQTKKVKQGEYGCLMSLVPHELAQEIVAWGVKNIPDDALYIDDNAFGRELEIHCTIKYGLIEDDPKTARRLFNNHKPFRAKLGKIKHFEPNIDYAEFDVVTIEVESDDLIQMNKEVCEKLECAKGLPADDYKPHITLAYVKKGKGKEFIGSEEFSGREIELNEVIFSPAVGNRTYFSIGDSKKEAAYRGNISLWLAPDGKEFPIYGSHYYWINKNLNILRKMYKEIPEQGEQWAENSVNWLISKGWTRVDGVLPTELDLQIADINNIPQAAEQFVWKYKPEMVIVEDLQGNDTSFDREEYSKGMMKHASSNIQDINGVRVYINPTPKQAVNLLKQSKEHALRYIATDEDIYMWDAYFSDHRAMAEQMGLTEDPNWYDGAGTFITEDNAYQKAEIFMKHSLELQPIAKKASGNNFLPSLVQAPNNEWQFQYGGDDQEIPVDPDPISDELTDYAPCTVGKPRSPEVWRQFISLFQKPISKKEIGKESIYDPEFEEIERKELGEDETLNDYARDFYDPKKHDFPHNTTMDSLVQDMEPSKPLPVTYSPESNEDNLDQNSPGGYPRRFMGKPKGEWSSTDGEIIPVLENMFKNREAAINSITRDITSSRLHAGGWISPNGKYIEAPDHFRYVDQHLDEFGLSKLETILTPYERMTAIMKSDQYIYDQGWIRVRVMSEVMRFQGNTFQNIKDHAEDFIYSHLNDVERIWIALNDDVILETSVGEFKEKGWDAFSKTPVMAKQAGSYSSTYTDSQGEQYYTEQHMNDIDCEPYVTHDQRDYPWGFHDSPENTDSGIGWAKDNQPYVVRLDQLYKGFDRPYPPGLPDYEVQFYISMPADDGIIKGNPD